MISEKIISEILGNSSRIKILEFLINNKENSFSVSYILMGASVKHRNAVDILKDLVEKDLIYIEKRIGKSNMYKINEHNEFIQALIFAREIKEIKKT